MAAVIQNDAGHSNWLDKDGIPVELKLRILEYTSSHMDLLSLLEAYPTWVNYLWASYPKQLFHQAFDNVLKDLDWEIRDKVLRVYHIREIRWQYAKSMRCCVETQQHRDALQAKLHHIVSVPHKVMSLPELPELAQNLQTILDIGKVIQDVNSLTDRYSNDAWKRIHSIAKDWGSVKGSSADLEKPPAINLTWGERARFSWGFLNVEIYLLTKYWTNAHGERHTLDMGREIWRYVPHSWRPALIERPVFDSCLRYMFDSYRTYLKKTARDLGVPELPTRDDLVCVPNELDKQEDRYQDYPVSLSGDPTFDFQLRSVSEEQRFLLWLCECGLAPLEQIHQADDGARRAQLIRQFGERHTWDTVDLRHRVARYDAYPLGHPRHPYDERPRNRHPIKSLYGPDGDEHLQYETYTSSSWACATAFLIWDWSDPKLQYLQDDMTREGVTLGARGRHLKHCDTDKGQSRFCPFRRAALIDGHPYLLEPDKDRLHPSLT